MTVPSRPEHAAVELPLTPGPLGLWSAAGAGATAKYLVGAIGAAVGVIITTFRTPVLPSNIAQCAALALLAVALYFGKPAPAGVPAAAARWFQSAKVWLSIAGTILTALVPLFVTYLDTGDWRNLSNAQWLVVLVAVLTAFTSWSTTNREVTTFDADGNVTNPTALHLEALGARHDALTGSHTITTLDPGAPAEPDVDPYDA